MQFSINTPILFKATVKQSLHSPWWFQKVEAPRFQAIRRMKVVRLSTLRTGRLYPEIFPVLVSVKGWVDHRTRVQPKGLYQRKIAKTLSGRELATFQLLAQCSPQPQSLFFPKYERPGLLICLVTQCPLVNSSKDRNAVIFTITQASLLRDPEDSNAAILQNDGYLPSKSV